ANGSEKAMNQGQMQQIQQLRENLLFDYFISSENLKLHQLNVKDQGTGNSIVVQYESFLPLGAVPFAHIMLAQVLQAGRISDVRLNQTNPNVCEESVQCPVSIPPGDQRL